jgi:hypothetical protein
MYEFDLNMKKTMLIIGLSSAFLIVLSFFGCKVASGRKERGQEG